MYIFIDIYKALVANHESDACQICVPWFCFQTTLTNLRAYPQIRYLHRNLAHCPCPEWLVLLQGQLSSAAAAAPKPWIGRELFGEARPPASYNIIKRLLKKQLPSLYDFKQMPPKFPPWNRSLGLALCLENPFLSLSTFSGWLKVQNSPHLKGFSQSEGQRLVQPVKAVGSNHPWNAANVIILKWIYFIHVGKHENCCFESAYMYTGIVLPTWEQYKPTQVFDNH